MYIYTLPQTYVNKSNENNLYKTVKIAKSNQNKRKNKNNYRKPEVDVIKEYFQDGPYYSTCIFLQSRTKGYETNIHESFTNNRENPHEASGGSRISPRRGRQLPKVLLFCHFFEFGPPGGRVPGAPP